MEVPGDVSFPPLHEIAGYAMFCPPSIECQLLLERENIERRPRTVEPPARHHKISMDIAKKSLRNLPNGQLTDLYG